MKRKYLLNISLLFLFFLLFFPSDTLPQKNTTNSKYYDQGVAALGKQDITSAEKFFTISVQEISDVPSLYELAKIYINKNTIYGRRKARNYLEKAIWIEPRNINLRLTYASLMEKYSKGIAFKAYENIIKVDSQCSLAWYNMGRLVALEFNDYHNSVKKDDDIELSLENFAEGEFNEAESYFNKALKYDSLNPDIYLQFSYLYEDAGEYNKGITLLENLVKRFPDNEGAHLFLGLLYYRTSQIPKSFKEYQDALLIMPISERLDFTYNSVVELLDPVAEELIKSLNPKEVKSFIDAFWNYSDPLYLTDYNERLLEHYSRVAYANLRFSLPDEPGWKTDRGEIVLRYGEPLKRTRYRPQINAGGRTEVQVKTDVWEYKDMIFGFEDSFMSGNFRFAEPFPGSRYIAQFNGDTQMFAEYVRKARFESYDPIYEGPAFQLSHSIVQFKNLDKSSTTDVYFNYAIPYNDTLVDNGYINYKYNWGLFFTDNYSNSIYRDKGNIEKLSLNNTIETDSGKYAINSAEMTVKPDSGLLAFEIIRKKDKGVSSNHNSFTAEKFPENQLSISDILLAEKIVKDLPNTYPVKRNEISILPNPVSEFSKNDNLYLYYEIYNLAINNSDLTDFQQKVTIQKAEEENSLEKGFNSILKFVGLKRKQDVITLSSHYQTREKNSQIYFQLDMSKSNPGKYIITVNVHDNLSGKESSSSTFVNLYK